MASKNDTTPKRPKDDQLIDIDEYCRLTGRAKSSVYSAKCRRTLEIPHIEIDRRVRFWRSDVLNWISANTVPPASNGVTSCPSI